MISQKLWFVSPEGHESRQMYALVGAKPHRSSMQQLAH